MLLDVLARAWVSVVQKIDYHFYRVKRNGLFQDDIAQEILR
jgi:hypothetical protein